MLTTEIIGLMLNKWVLSGLAGLIALIIAYFKGKAVAKSAAETERLEAEKARDSRLRAAEAKNAWLEKQGEQKNEAINGARAIDDLMRLWDAFQSREGSGSPSDKDPKRPG